MEVWCRAEGVVGGGGCPTEMFDLTSVFCQSDIVFSDLSKKKLCNLFLKDCICFS